jgi:hypothetical protein
VVRTRTAEAPGFATATQPNQPGPPPCGQNQAPEATAVRAEASDASLVPALVRSVPERSTSAQRHPTASSLAPPLGPVPATPFEPLSGDVGMDRSGDVVPAISRPSMAVA